MSKNFTLEDRIHACWMGKNIGGTLGGPYEGRPGPLDLDFYNPVPRHALPNDDLDLQVVWIYYLLKGGHRTVTPDILADAWTKHVQFPFDEYAIAHRNNAYGLKGTDRGSFDNYFAESMGAAIRSEMWACIAPGEPARAAAFAWADAVVDHCGDGVLAAVFHAAIQSAAFVESDRSRLMETALAFLPDGSRLKQGLLDTQRWWDETREWQEVRTRIVTQYATGNFTDVVCNLCFELLGWMDGGDDFGRAICTAVNCGFDTDCTGATLGALLGIINPRAIPQKWIQPIGQDVVISKEIVGVEAPANLTVLTEWTLRLRVQLQDFQGSPGPIIPRLPAVQNNKTGSFPMAYASSSNKNILAQAAPPSLVNWHEKTAYGHWQQWTTADFPVCIKLLKTSFTVEKEQAVKLMLYYRPGLTAWVDGKQILTLTENCLTSDTFAAPSLHRPGKSAVIIEAGELSAGQHELILACCSPSQNTTADLVIALGDPLTNQWLPHAFLRLVK